MIWETELPVSSHQSASERRVLHPSGGLAILLARVISLCLLSSAVEYKQMTAVTVERPLLGAREGPYTTHVRLKLVCRLGNINAKTI